MYSIVVMNSVLTWIRSITLQANATDAMLSVTPIYSYLGYSILNQVRAAIATGLHRVEMLLLYAKTAIMI